MPTTASKSLIFLSESSTSSFSLFLSLSKSCISLIITPPKAAPDQIVVLVLLLVKLLKKLSLEGQNDLVNFIHLGLLLFAQSLVHFLQTLAVFVALQFEPVHFVFESLQGLLAVSGRARELEATNKSIPWRTGCWRKCSRRRCKCSCSARCPCRTSSCSP